MMEQHGFLCSPSPTNPQPKAPYFRGGYNTQRHGRDAAPLAGLQIETYSRGVRDTAASREKFARALATTMEAFLELHIGIPLAAPKPAAPIAAAASTEKAATFAACAPTCQRRHTMARFFSRSRRMDCGR